MDPTLGREGLTSCPPPSPPHFCLLKPKMNARGGSLQRQACPQPHGSGERQEPEEKCDGVISISAVPSRWPRPMTKSQVIVIGAPCQPGTVCKGYSGRRLTAHGEPGTVRLQSRNAISILYVLS